jgi:GAF domain-containing protein
MPSQVPAAFDHRSVEQLRRQLAEAREQQIATAEILAAISSAPTDPRGVFEKIAASAARLCDAYDASIFQVDGDHVRIVAHHGKISPDDTLPLTRGSLVGRAVLEQRTIHIADLQIETDEYPEGSGRARRLGFRTTLGVPLIRGGAAIGVIVIRRTEARLFSVGQIALLETFADQAVIAIENTRLFHETKKALERQTATAEILKVIASSPSDTRPVFNAIATSANRLLGGLSTAVWRFEGGNGYLEAFTPTNAAADEALKALSPIRISDFRVSAVLSVREGKIAQVLDTEKEPPQMRDIARLRGFRSALFAPLKSQAVPIGFVSVTRRERGAFDPDDVQLLQTFADQAVIAIENTRLFEAEQASKRELQVSLEYQTATSEVLSVISRSPDVLQPVLDTIVRTAQRLCQSERAQFFRLQNGKYHLAAQQGTDPTFLNYLIRNPISADPESGSTTSKAVRERRTIHVPDVFADPDFAEGHLSRGGRGRSLLAVPLTREGEVIAVITLVQTSLKPFTDRQIALIETFAAQAVIAIENTRLFEAEQTRTRELTERTQELTQTLEYQTATSDVLGVISRSPTNVQPVFDMIAESAMELCHAEFCNVLRFDGQLLHFVASHGLRPEARRLTLSRFPLPPERGFAAGRAILSNAVEELTDVNADTDYALRDIAKAGAYGSIVAVPMKKDGSPIGALAVGRSQVGPFPSGQIELLKTFADQAVIAIENTRLFEAEQASKRELQESLEQQIATSEVLQIISSSPGDLQPVFEAILANAVRLCEAKFGNLFLREGDTFRAVAVHGPPTDYVEWYRREPVLHKADITNVPLGRLGHSKKSSISST